MTLTMYDAVDVSAIPPNAEAVAGYVDGKWQTFPTLEKKFPKAHRLSIAVFAKDDADCLDIEQFDATPAEAPAWVKRQLARGVKRPVVYTPVSQAQTVLDALKAAGIGRGQFLLWSAHYTFQPHLCSSKCWATFHDNADATQWTDKALGKSLDASLVANWFFSTHVPMPTGKAMWFKYWYNWLVGGKRWARPGSAPKFIPAWAWKAVKAAQGRK